MIGPGSGADGFAAGAHPVAYERYGGFPARAGRREPERIVTDSYSIRERGTVAAAIRGDADAMRAVWQQHRRWVAAVLLAHKPREMDVEDLVQDVAVSFVKTIGTLRDESSLRPWLRTVAINAARASGRRSRRLRAHGEVATGADVPAPVEPVDPPRDPGAAEREEASRLMDLAMTLPDGYREPLLLKCVRGLSYRAISELLGLPETTIETRIARGRRMLRDLASGREGTPGGPGSAPERKPERRPRNDHREGEQGKKEPGSLSFQDGQSGPELPERPFHGTA
jgi:RNA polymerase sigma-70 factor (ECF subfamily)